MKRKFLSLLSVVVVVCSFTACGKTENTVSVQQDEASVAEAKQESEPYGFEVDGVRIVPDMDFDSIKDSLGKPLSTFESESCAKQGMAYHYTYANYEVETYPDGDVNRVYCISLTNDTVKTSEGIDLSNSRNDVIAVYGQATESTENSLVYQKEGSDSKLKFIFESDDAMISIEYDSKEM